ncbi:MAG: carboxypeptidase regulatory-like domain-containing protein [bacterium]
MKHRTRGAMLGAILVVLMVGVVWAQTDAPVIKERAQGEVKYLVGGVGLEEREYMTSVSGNYNLKLVFAMASREYLAEVRVVILDPKGKTYVTTTADGPWMMVKLPQGSYLVQATAGGQTLAQKCNVGKALQVLNFHWK